MYKQIVNVDSFSRYFYSFLGFLITWVFAFLTSNEISDQAFILIYYATFFSGWCALSFRQKVHSIFVEKTNDDNEKRNVKIFFVYVFFITCSIFFAVNVSSSNDKDIHSFSLALFVLSFSVNSISYAFYWAKKQLYFSYFFDSLHYITLVISFVLWKFLSFNFFHVWAILLFFSSFVLFFISGAFNKVFSLVPDKDLLFAAVSSQLIAFLSFAEVFIVEGVGTITEYRLLMTIVMGVCLGLSVYRQRQISRGIYTIGENTLLIFFFSSTVIFLLSQLVTNFILLSICLFCCIVFQTLLSIEAYKFIRRKQSFILLFIYFFSVILVVCILYFSGPVVDIGSLLLLKIRIVYSCIFLFCVITFVYNLMWPLEVKRL